jgi:acyl carrier protein
MKRINMSLQIEIKALLQETLQLDEVDSWDEDTGILGSIPEFDSMAIVTILTMVEENYGIMIEDDEVSAEVFETLGSLVDFISERVG